MFLQIVHEYHKVLESCYISINCLAIYIHMHLVESNNNDDKCFLMELVGTRLFISTYGYNCHNYLEALDRRLELSELVLMLLLLIFGSF